MHECGVGRALSCGSLQDRLLQVECRAERGACVGSCVGAASKQGRKQTGRARGRAGRGGARSSSLGRWEKKRCTRPGGMKNSTCASFGACVDTMAMEMAA